MPKRICHISTVHVPRDVRIFVRECRSLAGAGYEVHLVIRAPRAEVCDGVHVHPLRLPQRRFLRMLWGPWIAWYTALRTRADLYHYHDPELLWMGFVLHWLLGRQVVYDVHECVYRQILTKPYLPRWIASVVSAVFRVVERWLVCGQTVVVANDHSMNDYRHAWLVRNFPVLDDRVIVRQRTFGEHAGRPCLVYVGGMAEIRGAWVYMELARRLAQRGRDFQMRLIGPYAAVLGQALQEKIEQWGLNDKVTLTGRMDWVQAMHIVSQSAIGLCLLLPVPNYTTCLATKILEYMMVGTPVLASRFDCWRPYVEGQQAGMMADPANPDEVVSLCERMLDDEDQWHRMSLQGMAAVRERYNWDREFQQLLRCYEWVLGSSEGLRKDLCPAGR